jgi:hypothetical protein
MHILLLAYIGKLEGIWCLKPYSQRDMCRSSDDHEVYVTTTREVYVRPFGSERCMHDQGDREKCVWGQMTKRGPCGFKKSRELNA